MTPTDRRKGLPDPRPPDGRIERRVSGVSERRRTERVPVHLWAEEVEGNDLYLRQTGNLSTSGVFFERTIIHPIGTKLKLRFQLPDEPEPIHAEGEVVSHPANAVGIGVRFLDLRLEARLQIARFLTRLTS